MTETPAFSIGAASLGSYTQTRRVASWLVGVYHVVRCNSNEELASCHGLSSLLVSSPTNQPEQA